MNALQAFSTTLRTLLNNKPYHRITVQDLCDKANLSRRTFYKYYEDKDAVVRALIREDFVEPSLVMRSIMNLEEMESAGLLLLERTYKAVSDDKVCYRNLLANLGKLKLLEFIIEESGALSRSIYATYDYPEDEMDYVSYIMASVTATTTIRWIESDFNVSCSRMGQLFSTWMNAHWRELGFPQK